jgi:hypothetical protein
MLTTDDAARLEALFSSSDDEDDHDEGGGGAGGDSGGETRRCQLRRSSGSGALSSPFGIGRVVDGPTLRPLNRTAASLTPRGKLRHLTHLAGFSPPGAFEPVPLATPPLHRLPSRKYRILPHP